MRLPILHLIALILAPLILAQTPPNTQPSTTTKLAVSYGNTTVTPGIGLPLSIPKTLPTITHPTSPQNQTYILLLVDLSISTLTLNTTTLNPTFQLPLAPGIAQNRTTRLHYFQAGLTFTPAGTLLNTTTPIAYYQPPAPPPGDIAHTYVFYLFSQDASFLEPGDGSPFSRALVNMGSNRMSFDVEGFAGEIGVGELVGANYFLARNGGGGAAGTSTAGGTGQTGVPFLGGVGKRGVAWSGIGVVGGVVVGAILGCV